MLTRLAVLVVLVSAMAGCTTDSSGANEITMKDSEVLPNNSRSRSLVCEGSAQFSVVASGGTDGWFSAQVRDGNDVPLFSQQFNGGNEASEDKSLGGNQGLWTLRVDKSQEYDGTFNIVLTCS